MVGGCGWWVGFFIDQIVLYLQSRGKLLFYNKELSKVHELTVSDAVSVLHVGAVCPCDRSHALVQRSH